MPRSYFNENQQSVIRTEEFDFKIRISNREMEFWDYRRRLYKSLSKRKGVKFNDNYPFEKSPIETFISQKVDRLNKDEECIAFLTNYREVEGSFVVAFSIFVFTTIMNYGQLMDSLNSLKRDLEYFFEDEFSNDTDVQVNYVNRPNRIFERAENNIRKSIVQEIAQEFKKLKLIVLTIGIVAGALSLFAVFKSMETKAEKQPYFEKEVIRNEVRKELDEIQTKEKINKIYELLTEKKNDSIKK